MALYIDSGKQNEKRPDYVIPVRLLRWVEYHGFANQDDALKFLTHAVKHSAPITHPEGNRRYDSLLLRVQDRRVTDLAVFEPQCSTCGDTKRFIAYDPDGTERSWPCPDCKQFDKRRAKGNHRRQQPRR